MRSPILPNELDSPIWRPTSTLEKVTPFGEPYQVPNSPAPSNASTDASPSGPVKQVLSVTATESPSKQQDRTFSLISVSFTRDTSDANFLGVRIWIKGYKGNPGQVLYADGNESPISFLLESTGESVQVFAQAFSSDSSASLDSAPSTTVLLDGVISAPPAPSIASSLTPTPVGYQFSFNFLSGLAADIVDGYNVYRNTSNSFAGATRVAFIKHNPLNIGAYVYQEAVSAGAVNFYWVTAVNTKGLESSATAAQSGSVAAGVTDYFDIPQVENANFEASSALPPPGWTINDPRASLSYETSTQQSGNRSLKIVTTTQFGGAITTRKFRVQPNNRYSISGYAKSDGTVANLQLAFLDASGNYISGLQISTSSTSWTFLATTGIAPANAVSAEAYLSDNSVGGGTCYFDNISVTRGLDSSYLQVPLNAQYSFTASGILTQSGTSTTISVSAFTIQYGFGQVSYSSGSVDPGSYGTFYVYCDDPTYSGGAMVFHATTSVPTLTAAEGRILLGTITTVNTGGGSGGGNGGGHCCFSPNTCVLTPHGPVPFSQLNDEPVVMTKFGPRPAKLVTHEFDGELIDMGGMELVTPTHPLQQMGKWIPARDRFQGAPKFPFKGTVYNLAIETEREEERHYLLANGEIAHNQKIFDETC